MTIAIPTTRYAGIDAGSAEGPVLHRTIIERRGRLWEKTLGDDGRVRWTRLPEAVSPCD